jgi:hypothetical protein
MTPGQGKGSGRGGTRAQSPVVSHCLSLRCRRDHKVQSSARRNHTDTHIYQHPHSISLTLTNAQAKVPN